MIVVFPFHSGDIKQAEAWMRWAGELGGCRNHQIILMPAKGIADFAPIRELALSAFGQVDVLPDAEGITGHPEGPNSMMRQAIWHMQMANLGPWTYWEPDCIMLTADCVDVWEREYRAFGKPFMGEFRPAHDVTPDYLSGNMVLPKDALLIAPMLARRGLSKDGVELAFDIVAASQTLPLAHLTKLLQQVPKTDGGGGATFPDQDSLKLLRPGAVMFHPCKDGTLIDRLRERRNGVTAPAPAGSRSLTESASPVEPSLGAGAPRALSASITNEAEALAAMAAETIWLDQEFLQKTYVPNLLKRIAELEKQLAAKQPRKNGKRMRTVAEQAAIDARMAKARAGRGKPGKILSPKEREAHDRKLFKKEMAGK